MWSRRNCYYHTDTMLRRKEEPLIAITEFSFVEKYCSMVRNLLKQEGYEVITFHAQGKAIELWKTL